MDELVKKLKDQAPELVKDNKFAVAGAVIGYLLSDSMNPKTKNAILGAVAGAIIGDKKDGK